MTNKLTTTERWWMLWLTVGILIWVGIFSIGKCSAQEIKLKYLEERLRIIPPAWEQGMELDKISQEDLGDITIFSYSIDSGYYWKLYKEFQKKQQIYIKVPTDYEYFNDSIYIFSQSGVVSWTYGVPPYFDILPLYMIEITGGNNVVAEVVERDMRGMKIQKPLSRGYGREINTSMYEVGDTLVVDEYRSGHFRILRKGEKIKDRALIGILNKTK